MKAASPNLAQVWPAVLTFKLLSATMLLPATAPPAQPMFDGPAVIFQIPTGGGSMFYRAVSHPAW